MAKLSRLGQYKLVRKLGQGGMGTVFEGVQDGLDRRVAIKVLPAQFMRDPSFVERFKREAKAAACLNHPNIVTVYEIGEDQGFHYFSMELVDGLSLQQRLKEQGPLDISEAITLMLQTILGLGHAWEKQIVHRDIKPDNLMLTKAGVLKITDLGLARVRHEMGTMTQSGAGMGTPYYMSPEQGYNARDADLRSDVYSLGATFYHLLTGRVPFEGSSPIEVAIKVSTATFPPVRQVRPDTPPAVAAIIEKMLARNADERYPNAAALLAALQPLADPRPRSVTVQPISFTAAAPRAPEGCGWIKLSPSGTPPKARTNASAAWDPSQRQLLIFGGADDTPWDQQNPSKRLLNDLWVYSADSNNWVQLSPSGTPPTRRESSVAFWDQVERRMLLFGGWDGQVQNDLWAYQADSNAWREIYPEEMLPEKLESRGAVWDPAERMIYVWDRGEKSPLNQLWVYRTQTNSWLQLIPSGLTPPTRMDYSAVWEPGGRRMLIFGGFSGSYPEFSWLNDLWAYVPQTNTWIQINPRGTKPSPRRGSAAVWDSMGRRMLVLGGIGGGNENLPQDQTDFAYLMEANAWTRLVPSGQAPPWDKTPFGVVWDSNECRMLVFGGYNSKTKEVLNDLSAYVAERGTDS